MVRSAAMTRRAKPAMAAWIARERKRLDLKPVDLATRLSALGLEVSAQTVRVWESYAGRNPSPDNIEGLERIFGTEAPTGNADSGDTAALVSLVGELLEELRAERAERVAFERGLVGSLQELAQALARRDAPAGVPPEDALR